MSSNWYQTESWYAPLREAEPPKEEREKKKGPGRWRAVVAMLLVLALIVTSSLAFSNAAQDQQTPAPAIPREDEDGLPEDWQKFFESYYQSTQTDVTEINIPRTALPMDFQLTLEESLGEELSLGELYERCAPTVVAISAYQEGYAGYYWGSGVILSEDGLILTNTHVIENCDSATVTLFDDSVYEAALVGADSISDIAVLKIEAAGLPVASFGESAALQVGDGVAAIGNPLGETFRSTLTDGIISAIERGVSYHGHSMTLLQTNTAINEGNSGGALFNRYGQVVGVTNMKMMSSYSSIEGIGFAIPSATVRNVVNALVRDGEVRGRPSVGITVGAIPEAAAAQYDLPEGLYVSAVVEGSDAAAKGIQVGDVITEVNHTPVTTTAEINEMKNGLAVGDSMTFTIWRDGETLEIEVELMDTNDVYGG